MSFSPLGFDLVTSLFQKNDKSDFGSFFACDGASMSNYHCKNFRPIGVICTSNIHVMSQTMNVNCHSLTKVLKEHFNVMFYE